MGDGRENEAAKGQHGTPGGDGAVSRLCQCEHPSCTAALQDVITGGNGVKGAQEPRVISCNCIWLHN